MNNWSRSIVGLFLSLILMASIRCGSGDDAPIQITPTESTASLFWNPAEDPRVYAYLVHYGTQSSNRPGSCRYEHQEYVSASAHFVTITGLEPNTQYYFAVSAYDGSISTCSDEVSIITAPAGR
jgi:hypothetical protein